MARTRRGGEQRLEAKADEGCVYGWPCAGGRPFSQSLPSGERAAIGPGSPLEERQSLLHARYGDTGPQSATSRALRSPWRCSRALRPLLVGLAAFALLAACTSAATPTSRPVGTATPTRATASAGAAGTLTLTDSGPITLDPATTAESGSAFYIFQIFSGLLRLDQDMKLVADIAETWDKSEDGQTYTFHLRHDATFHDGKPVKASDFKYSWERALNPATRSLTAMTYLNDIVGAAEVAAGNATALSGVRVVDDYTLEVKIDAPKAYFLFKMAYPTAFVVEKANVESGANWWQRPVGTGPFKLREWQKDQRVVLQRNADYYGDKARLDQVVFKLFNGNPMDLYQTGEIDVTYTGGAYMGLITDPSNPLSRELTVYPELSFQYLGFNTSTPPFDDANVRQAFSLAIDKERITTLSAMNTVSTAYGILPPGMPGYDAGLQGLRFDPEKAKRLIAESKYGDVSKLPPVVLTVSGYGGGISGVLGGVIAEWRRNLGVEVTVRQLEPQDYLYSLAQEKNEMYSSGWIADYPDPQDFIDVLFRSGSPENHGGYSNPQLDALLDQAAVEQDTAKRLGMYQQAERILVDDAAVLPLFFGKSYLLVKPYVKGYELTPLGYPLLNQVSIQK